MVLLGDIANSQYINSRNNNSIEVFCELKNLSEVKKKFKITEGNKPVLNTALIQSYKRTDGTTVNIYSSARSSVTQSILADNAAVNGIVRICNPKILYMWLSTKVTNVDSNIIRWDDNMRTLSHLYFRYFNKNEEYLKKLLTEKNKYSIASGLTHGLTSKPYTFKKYELFTELSLFQALSRSPYPLFRTLYHRPRVNSSSVLNYNREVWNNMPYMDKLNAIRERIEVTASNEYFLPEIVLDTTHKTSTHDIYRLTLMRYISDYEVPTYIKNFIKHNYNQIFFSLNFKISDFLLELVNTQLLEEVN